MDTIQEVCRKVRGGRFVETLIRGGTELDVLQSLLDRKKYASIRAKSAAETRANNRTNPSTRFFNNVLQAKIRNGNYENLTAGDLLGIYLEGFRRRFEHEDPDFMRNGAFEKERGIISVKVRDMFENDRYKMYRYIVNTLDWWKYKLDNGSDFPASLPSFGSVFCSNWFYKNYRLHCKELNLTT